MNNLKLSPLAKTWVFDVDGTLLIHNGHLRTQGDEVLPGVKEFFSNISPKDKVILLTARKEIFRDQLETFLNDNGIRFDRILYEMPMGERILVNDKKPSGLITAYAVNKERNAPLDLNIVIDETL
jgi:FMN phosphatase YigB (HAD superfamily)